MHYIVCTDCGTAYATADAAHRHAGRLAYPVTFITVKRAY